MNFLKKLFSCNKNISTNIVANCLGDSITAGFIGGSEGYANPTWCEQIADNLNITVNNYGVSATSICEGSSESFIDRLNRMKEDNIDLLIIFGGANDYGDCKATLLGSIVDEPKQGTNFYASFKYLIEVAVNKYPGAVICVITPMRRSDNNKNKYGISIENIVNAEIEIAKYYNLLYYDFYHNGGINPEFDIHREKWTMDGLHPNQVGIDKWLAPQFTKVVADLLTYKKLNN